ncbi:MULTISPECIES: helix-turn-helix domain-containing protein [Listeria]|uniref:Helix-turn-helix transcriptional regulator n=1 Tax=Listeria immobilis TaxID=2713502 RepID=A0A7X0X9E2_9LIST|nr:MULTISPECIES: helix-turn-helix transcriptional regulator [Listeria]MBC1470764.1 helix-turn-helix transcriptional regulator [Listeria seeligeri]MBC1489967.1 helix-turn-helix transcriptional regulator [Listeria immobilis]MBC1536961.1 helix-turn-helix transcriptional regulator [Listeria immobilis]
MTTRKEKNQNQEIGNLLKSYRMKLTDIPRSRQNFINDRSEKYFGYEEWISEKTLMNYETGKNIPSLQSLKKLSIALEVDLLEFLSEIMSLL